MKLSHLALISRLFFILHTARPHRIISHYLCIQGNDDILTETTLFRDSLQKKLDSAQTEDDVFIFAEEISAIRRSVDKGMRIVLADDDDASLASSAIYRLGSIMASQRARGSASYAPLLDFDRRYEQLVECVELRIKTIKVADLSRYLWAATSLKVIDETQANLAFNEYSRRLKLAGDDGSHVISAEEAAAILWAVGCLKDTYGWTSTTLISLLCDHLDEGDALSTLSSKLIVRVLWSLALHNSYDVDICRHGLSAIDSRGLENLSQTNAINLLWSVSQFKDLIDVDLMLHLLTSILSTVENREYLLGVAEIGLAAEALVALKETAKLASEISLSIHANANENGPYPSIEKLQAIIALIEKCMGSLILCFTENSTASNHVTLPALISILRVATTECTTSPGIWDFAINQFESFFTANTTVTVIEAASILEIITFVPRTLLPTTAPLTGDEGALNELNEQNEISLTPVPNPIPEQSLHSPKGLRLEVDGTRNPRWHRIAGRLAAISASSAAQVKDKACLINACWAIASLGYPYRKLLSAVRKSIQFALHELSPNLLARLVVAVAAEECLAGPIVTAGAAGLRASPKLDREFVDQVALSVYHNLAGMTPLSNQISAMVAVACLGRLTSFELRISPVTASSSSTSLEVGGHRSVTISSGQLSTLSTSTLIKLFWAIHRLPEGIVSAVTTKAVQVEISARGLAPSVAVDGVRSTGCAEDAVTSDDLKLFARVLSESKALSDSSDETVGSACIALLQQLQSHVEPTEDDITTFRENFSRSQVAAEAASLCDALQSFIDLKWTTPEALQYMQDQNRILSQKLDVFSVSSGPAEDSLCACAYHIGRLTELLKIFKNLQTSKGSESRYDIGKQLSRWLGMN